TEAKKIRYTGHCSERDVAGLVPASGDNRAGAIGVGGGALLDSAQVLARRLGVPLVALPTIAAPSAAWTPLSVWYIDARPA
ncbi:iron-containing alcohol dehydrogenase, partial [Klebsiella pneumoniae]|uniref:iron-containing alcohol dehydrogenase n=1 Tax=Klebsiella pneumoniae TaxID=573 RepID=UPI00273215CC